MPMGQQGVAPGAKEALAAPGAGGLPAQVPRTDATSGVMEALAALDDTEGIQRGAARLPFYLAGIPGDLLGLLLAPGRATTQGQGGLTLEGFLDAMASQPGGSEHLISMAERAGILPPLQDTPGEIPAVLMAAMASPTTRANVPQRFSRLENAIERIGHKEMSAEGWKAALAKAPGGVAKGEMEWTGVSELLDLYRANDMPVRREELLDAVRSGRAGMQPRVDELRAPFAYDDLKDIEAKTVEAEWHFLREAQKAYRALRPENHSPPNFAVDFNRAHRRGASVDEALRSAEAAWNLEPGALNPSRRAAENYHTKLTQFDAVDAAITGRDATAYLRYTSPEQQLVLPGSTNQRERLTRIPEQVTAARGQDAFVSDHYPHHSNLVVSTRLNDRITRGPDGRPMKTLFVEEIQSDWHQAGRKEGYVSESPWRLGDVDPDMPPHGGDDAVGPYLRVRRALSSDDRAVRQAAWDDWASVDRREFDIPDGPFAKTEEWTELAIKDIIDEAIAGDYDRIAFINGDQTVHRYYGSAALDDITFYTRPMEGGSARINLETSDGLQHSILSPGDAVELLGAELGKEVWLSATPTRTTLSGVQVRGAGHKRFYDQVVPKQASGASKRLGGAPAHHISLPDIDGLFPAIDISPQMRNRHAQEGQRFWGAIGALLPAAAAQQQTQQQTPGAPPALLQRP